MDVFADGISVTTNSPSYEPGTPVIISGTVSEKLFIEKPFYQPVPIILDISPGHQGIINLFPDEFSKFEFIYETLEHFEGIYSVKATYGQFSDNTTFVVEKILPTSNLEQAQECSGTDFQMIINIADEGDEDYSIIADQNNHENMENIRSMSSVSNNPLELLENIECQLLIPKSKSHDELMIVQETNRWNSDGSETYEYITSWTKFRAYNDVIRDINEIQEIVKGGMSVESAFKFLGYADMDEEYDPVIKEPDKESFDEHLNQIEELNNRISQLTLRVNELIRKNNALEKENESLEKRLDEIIQKQIEEENVKKDIASFVDKSKDPNSYVDRYYNEEKYREWFHENYPDYKSIHEAVGMREPVPDWIKNSAQWWSEGLISEDEFVSGIEYLVKEKIIDVN